MKGHYIFGLIALIGIAVVICLYALSFLSSENSSDPRTACNDDYDCVQSDCCHANDTVNKAYFPDCSGMICTAECMPNTLDCAQGEIKCIKNKCTIVWNEEQISKYAT